MSCDLMPSCAPLSRNEHALFEQLDSVVETHRRSFVQVGLALQQIRDGRLYRADYATFENYIEQRFGWTYRRAQQLIAGADVAANMNTCSCFSDEAAVRPLVPLAPTDRQIVLDRLSQDHPENKYFTAKQVTAAVAACQVVSVRQAKREPTSTAAAPPALDKSPVAAAARRERIRELADGGASVPQIADAIGMAVRSVESLVWSHKISVPASRVMGKARRINSNHIIEKTVEAAAMLTAETQYIDWEDIDTTRVPEWVTTLRDAKTAITRFIKQLQETQGHAQHANDSQARVQGTTGEDFGNARP